MYEALDPPVSNGFRGRRVARPAFTTDGKRFYFTIEDRQSDGFVAEVMKK